MNIEISVYEAAVLRAVLNAPQPTHTITDLQTSQRLMLQIEGPHVENQQAMKDLPMPKSADYADQKDFSKAMLAWVQESTKILDRTTTLVFIPSDQAFVMQALLAYSKFQNDKDSRDRVLALYQKFERPEND